MFTTIIRATVASLALGATVQAASADNLAPKGLIITRTPSGGVSSVSTIGGNAPGGSKAPTLQTPGGGNNNQNAYGNNFFLGNSVNSHNSPNARQGTQVRQSAQPVCNGKGLCWSDARLKRDAQLIASLGNGLHLYRYCYVWSSRLYVGVMAQEVAAIAPGAVRRGADGYLRVDYRQLGLRLQTWEAWRHGHALPAPWGFAGRA
jgi:hypothetical protein